MIGILCEKNSAARAFASALGGQKGKYNGEDYIIVAARGHVYGFADPAKQVRKDLSEEYKSWNVKHLPWNEKDFAWKYVKGKDTTTLLNSLKTDLSKCDEIAIATDIDPTGEGQLIAWEVISELGLKPKKISRVEFFDESAKQLQKGFKERKPLPLDKNQDLEYVKALFRAKWDFLSMQWTRIATSHTPGKVLRQGRLKSAMVALVGDQLKAIDNYKKVSSFQNRFKDENDVIYESKDEEIFAKKEDVPQIYKQSNVVVDSKEIKSSNPPKLLDLASLSANLSSKGIKPKQVLDVYQKMYEAQIVSYPRTEDKMISVEQFNELLPLVDKIANVVGVDTSILTHRSARSTHVKDGGAHGANRPGLNVPNSLDELSKFGAGAKDIYEMLAKSFLMMFCENYEYEQQKGHVEAYPSFLGQVNVPKKPGFKAISDNMSLASIANAEGLGQVANPYIHELIPPKPQVPTWGWLKTQLEKRDVGTGATRTSTYAEVTNEKAKYPLLKDTKGKISMSDYGKASYILLEDTHIGNLDITERVMGQLKEIGKGKLDPDIPLSEVQQLIVEDIKIMEKNSKKLKEEMSNMSENKFEQKEKATGMWNGKEINFSRVWGGHRFTDEEVEKLLAGETIEIHGLKAKSGNLYGVKGKLSEQEYSGKKYIGFENLGFAPRKNVPNTWSGYTFSDEEKNRLLNGETIEIEGAVSKKTGNSFSCKLVFEDDGNGGKNLKPIFG